MKKYSISVAIDSVLDNFFLVHKDINTISGLYNMVIKEVETTLIKKTMALTDRNKRKTAKILGISRNTLLSKIKSLNLEEN